MSAQPTEARTILDSDNEAESKDASMRNIRQHFNEWAASVYGLQSLTRYTNCIYADEEVVDAVLSVDPQASNVQELLKPKAYVKILDYQFQEKPRQWSAEQIDDEQLRRELNAGDEGFPPIGVEACRRNDVGWMKVSAHVLMSRAYKVLLSDGWYNYYRRPPAVVHD
ncbi:hypothetical protein HII31_08098 [Pseudocercospora fuligena]|uniref:Uncharacterized protein n=1 Tax=Pseudocercospora fuligena TaxID=685502 RepID=A0A8H6RH80_9PEZI|nr:hypothetical protein HII31_08098 [Pseudocercospora fuligena]